MNLDFPNAETERLEIKDGETLLPIPTPFLEKLGWVEGDLLEIETIEFSDSPPDDIQYGLVLRKV